MFVDVNVVLDYVARREGHFEPVAKLMLIREHSALRIGVAASTIPFAYQQLTEKLDVAPRVATGLLERLASSLDILPVDERTLDVAFANPIEDLEDAVQYACAEAYGAQLVLTRDVTGFGGMPIPSTSPAELLSA